MGPRSLPPQGVLNFLPSLCFSWHWGRAVFDQQLPGVCDWLSQFLLWRTCWFSAASHFYLGQFSFFSAQILLLMTLIRLAFIDWLASGFSRFFD
jgi:hypothetical protein